MHALPGVDLFLDRDLVLGAGLEAAADVDVQPFGILAKHDEVDVRRCAPFQGAEPLVEELHGPVVDVEVELEPRAEQDVARVTVVGHTRIAERADEDRVELSELIVAAGRKGDARLEVVIRSPRQMFEVELHAEPVGHGRQDFDCLSRDLLADSITGDDRDLHVFCAKTVVLAGIIAKMGGQPIPAIRPSSHDSTLWIQRSVIPC